MMRPQPDMKLLPWTYPWPKRALTWLVWKCPVLRLPARWLFPKQNPYCRVVFVTPVSWDTMRREWELTEGGNDE